MEQANIHEAKTQLSKLLEAVENGEEVIIARAGKPIAKLIAYAPKQSGRRKLGMLDGQIWIGDDFDDPLPEEIQAAFEGRAD